MNSPLNKDEILKEFKKFMLSLWDEWDKIDNQWRPRWRDEYERELERIAKRCKGASEQKVYEWCRIQMDDIFYEKWHVVDGRLFYTMGLFRHKADWVKQVAWRFSADWYKWNAVTWPQVVRMEEKLSSVKGWNKEDSEEWVAECFARGAWIDPTEWAVKRGLRP